MPWDGCELWVGELRADGMLRNPERLVGGLQESIFQPTWSPDGVLYFVSDRSGWWNLCRFNASGEVEVVCAMEAEFGMPQWGFGMSSYAFESAGRIVCSYIQKGISSLALSIRAPAISPRSPASTPISSICAHLLVRLFSEPARPLVRRPLCGCIWRKCSLKFCVEP